MLLRFDSESVKGFTSVFRAQSTVDRGGPVRGEAALPLRCVALVRDLRSCRARIIVDRMVNHRVLSQREITHRRHLLHDRRHVLGLEVFGLEVGVLFSFLGFDDPFLIQLIPGFVEANSGPVLECRYHPPHLYLLCHFLVFLQQLLLLLVGLVPLLGIVWFLLIKYCDFLGKLLGVL